MTNLHKIRARICSVNSTQQITRTMKMIAVSKLRKTQTSLAGVRLFADKSQAVLNALLAGDASFEHPYLTPRRHVGRVCYVVFWGNRGLCGAYNQLLLRHLEGLVRAEARPCSVIVCGRWGRDVLAGTDLPVRQIFSDLSDTPTMAEALEIAEELKNLYRGRIHEYAEEYPGVKYVAGARPWAEKCDIAMPSATQNEIDGDDARQLLANGCFAVSEGANMPSTPEAVDAFLEAGILYAPGKAANAGGVSVSGLEMTQNAQHLSWSAEEVDQRLHRIMEDIHAQCVKYGKREDGTVNYVRGANVAGFMKVASAMMAQGIL